MPVITASTAASYAAKSHANGRDKAEQPLGRIKRMLKALYADVTNPELKPAERAQAMRAYVEGEKLKRVIQGKAANTSQAIKPAESASKSKPRQTGVILEYSPESKPNPE